MKYLAANPTADHGFVVADDRSKRVASQLIQEYAKAHGHRQAQAAVDMTMRIPDEHMLVYPKNYGSWD